MCEMISRIQLKYKHMIYAGWSPAVRVDTKEEAAQYHKKYGSVHF